MDVEMRKAFSLETEIMGGDHGDVKRLRILNRQLSWNDGEILWEADPRHLEILVEQLGLDGAKAVKTPGDKLDTDKTFRYRDLDGDCDTADVVYVNELYEKGNGKVIDEASTVLARAGCQRCGGSSRVCWACASA